MWRTIFQAILINAHRKHWQTMSALPRTSANNVRGEYCLTMFATDFVPLFAANIIHQCSLREQFCDKLWRTWANNTLHRTIVRHKLVDLYACSPRICVNLCQSAWIRRRTLAGSLEFFSGLHCKLAQVRSEHGLTIARCRQHYSSWSGTVFIFFYIPD